MSIRTYSTGHDSIEDGADLWTYRINETSGGGSSHKGVIHVYGNSKLRDDILHFLQSEMRVYTPDDHRDPVSP